MRLAFLRLLQPGEKRLKDRMLPQGSKIAAFKPTGIAETTLLGLYETVCRRVGEFSADRPAFVLRKVGPPAGIEIGDQPAQAS